LLSLLSLSCIFCSYSFSLIAAAIFFAINLVIHRTITNNK
jgi:hypothetical protein